MVNAKKDKKAKAAKKAKKQRKQANRTAITLSAPQKTDPNADNLWEKTIPLTDDGKPHGYDFTDGDPHLVELWDKQQKEDQMDLLKINRSHLLHLLRESLGLRNGSEGAFPEPPRQDVAIYQAMFLKSLSHHLPQPPKGHPCRVQLHSLHTAQHLNGQYALRHQRDEKSNRWQVQLESTGTYILVKEEHCTVVLSPNVHRGVALLSPEPTILNVVVFEILKDRLGQLQVMERSIISAWSLLLYVVFTYAPTSQGNLWLPCNTWSICCGIYVFITFQNSAECRHIRTLFSTKTQRTLCQDRSSTEHMQWKSDSYLSACLLMLMVRSTSTLFVVFWMIVFPFLMYLFEQCQQGTKEDKKCFHRLRIGFSWLNNIILLYYGWSVSWWALLTVCVVVFTELSKIGLGIGLFAVAWLMKNGRSGVSRVVAVVDPHKRIEHSFLGCGGYMFLVSVLLSLGIVWLTWLNESVWVVVLRMVLVLVVLALFPEYSVKGTTLVFFFGRGLCFLFF